MEKIPVLITVKQVMRILDKSERSAQRLLNDIAKVYSKKNLKYVTVREFCEYTSLDFEDIKGHLPDPVFVK